MTASKFKSERVKQNLTQDDVARVCGLTVKEVRAIEAGWLPPSKIRHAICDLLDCWPAEELFPGVPDEWSQQWAKELEDAKA